MKKQTGAIFLIAGTCIGSGMIALPMVMAKLGLIPSIALILATWLLSYYTALISIELHIKAGKGLSIGELGGHFSEPIAELAGILCLKLLSYALLAVYIYGSASILQNFFGGTESFNIIASVCALVFLVIFLLPMKVIDGTNRMLFVGLVATFTTLLIALATRLNPHNMPFFPTEGIHMSTWPFVIPFIFTSFGFQGSLHTISNYCENNGAMMKKALFWGTLIPTIVYTLWCTSTMGILFDQDPVFYKTMAQGDMEVGALVKELTHLCQWHSLQLLVWWISLLAIFTSVLGVGAGLCDSIKSMLPEKIHGKRKRRLIAVLATIIPSYIVSILVPNAFVVILGFAGMILAVIAIGIPLYLLERKHKGDRHFVELEKRWFIILSAAACAVIFLCEVYNITK